MFFSLLLLTFLLAIGVCYVVVKVLDDSVGKMLARIIQDEISLAWQKYIKFAAYVIGISGGVNIYQLERYIKGEGEDTIEVLNLERWMLEIYRIVIDTLQSLAWMYFVVWLLALIAFAIVRVRELKDKKTEQSTEEGQ